MQPPASPPCRPLSTPPTPNAAIFPIFWLPPYTSLLVDQPASYTVLSVWLIDGWGVSRTGLASRWDPRSPTVNIARTPVAGGPAPVGFDPRSPTVALARTPVPKVPTETSAARMTGVRNAILMPYVVPDYWHRLPPFSSSSCAPSSCAPPSAALTSFWSHGLTRVRLRAGGRCRALWFGRRSRAPPRRSHRLRATTTRSTFAMYRNFDIISDHFLPVSPSPCLPVSPSPLLP